MGKMPVLRIAVKLILTALAFGGMASAVQAQAMQPQPVSIIGVKPSYLARPSQSVPNGQAIVRAYYAPALDLGFVPQGVSLYKDVLYVGGYIQADETVRPQCRIYAIYVGPNNMLYQVMGYRDLPRTCNHAGGLAINKSGNMIVSDNIRLFVLTPNPAVKMRVDAEKRNAMPSVALYIDRSTSVKEMSLAGELKGTFVVTSSYGTEIGSYLQDKDKTVTFFFPNMLIDYGYVLYSQQSSPVDVFYKAQGAAYDSFNNLWTTAQASKVNYLNVGRTSTISYEMVTGLEGLAFASNGWIWMVSEAGTKKSKNKVHAFPAVFLVNPGLLQKK